MAYSGFNVFQCFKYKALQQLPATHLNISMQQQINRKSFIFNELPISVAMIFVDDYASTFFV